jgi:hypothetical protein
MARLRLPFIRLVGSFRLLRGLVRELGRIADAVEVQNQLLEACNPEAAARLRHLEVVVDPALLADQTGPSYVDPVFTARAEEVRGIVYQQTGRRLEDEELLQYLADTELDPRFRGES